MIPKVIHYCWFGRSPLPILALKCIDSWKKQLPDFEIKEWNEDNFDVSIIPYVKEAYDAKKYAFVSDYARFWILYHHGGLYFDTDVEVIKPMWDIIEKGAFMGFENSIANNREGGTLKVAPGLVLACDSQHPIYKNILDLYVHQKFYLPNKQQNLKTVVDYTTDQLCIHGLQNQDKIQNILGIWIYPCDYFNPKDPYTDEIIITPNTYSIHHYSMSWVPKNKILLTSTKKKLMRLFGTKTIEKIIKLLKLKEIRQKIK